MRKLNFLIILIILISTTAYPEPVKAASLVVTKTADTDDGVCNADCSLREAVDVAKKGDVITFENSLSGQTITLTSAIGLYENITINGSSLTEHIKIDGSGSSNIFFIPSCVTVNCEAPIDSNIVKLISLDIQNANFGLAAVVNYRHLQVEDVNFINNNNSESHWRAGAIYSDGNLLISNSTFTNNHADYGGAIYIKGQATIIAGNFLNNTSDFEGGAIYNEGKLSIYDTLFENNNSTWSGGGIYTRAGMTGAYTNILRSTFYNNTANLSGGGIMNEGQDAILKVSNSTFSSNNAIFNGGAIMNEGYDPLLEIINSTFTNNSSINNSGALHSIGNIGNLPPFLPSISIINTIIANSVGGVDCYIQDTTILENTNNIIENNGAGINSCGTPFSTADPMLAPLADNGGLTPTHYLLPGSPAINAGNNTKCAASPVNNTSQNGITRPVGGTCDIGSVEMPVITTPSVVSIVRSDNNPTNATSINYQVTFSESVIGVDNSDFSLTTSGVTGASINNVSGSESSYTVAVNSGSGNGTIRLDIVDDDTILSSLTMPLGGVGLNNGNFTSGEVYTIDKTPPTVTTINRVGTNPSNMLNVSYLVTFSENVTGVDATDFALDTTGVAGAFISNISGSGNTRVVSINTGQGSTGTIRLDFIDDDTVTDLAGNPITSEHEGDETYTIQKAILPAPILRSPRSTATLNDTTPNLVWQRVAKATQYEIQIADDANFTVNLLTDTTNTTTYTPSALSDGTYYWRVRAIDVSGAEGKWSQTRIFTIDTIGPNAPTLTSPIDGFNSSSRSVTFRWQSSSGAVSYQFAYDNDVNCTSPTRIVTVRSTSTRMTLPSGTYYWCVKAKDAFGNWGNWSTSYLVTIP